MDREKSVDEERGVYPVPQKAPGFSTGMNVPDSLQGKRPKATGVSPWYGVYWSPYLAGLAIGLTLIATYFVMGHGLGASGAFTQLTSRLVGLVAPDHAVSNAYLNAYLQSGPLWRSWIVLEVAGVLIGGFLGALTARRFRVQIERGTQATRGSRVLFALLGGFAVGFGSRLAQGCTSGQALSGGAVLAVGSWAFTLAFFLGGYLFAYAMRKEWQ